MDFSGQYLKYAEYSAMGGTLDIMPFNLAEEEARRIIDKETFNRLKNVEEIPMEVKLCMRAMIDMMKFDASYLDDDEETRTKKKIVLIREYLSNLIVNDEKLLYRGK